MSPFTSIEHTADIAYKISGETLEQLFVEATRAWTFTVSQISNYDNPENIELKFSGDSYESLLVDFLSELNYLFLTKKFLCFEIVQLSFPKSKKIYLEVCLKGIHITENNCEIIEEIKAVTYHQLEILKGKKGFETILIFDI